MPKTNNNQKPSLPQKTFIGVAFAAYMLNVVFWLALVIRVYSTKQIWFSPFLAMSIAEVLLPVALLSVAYLALRKQMSGLNLKFTATLLAVIGMLLNTFISQLYHLPMPSFGMWSLQILTVIGFFITGLIIISLTRIGSRRGSPNIIYRSFMGLAVGIYAIEVIFTVKDAIWRYTHGHDLSQLPMDGTLTHGVILPLIFFSLAYLLLSKNYLLGNRLFTATIYTAIGFLITISLTSIWMIATQVTSQEVIDYNLAVGVAVPVASLVIYLAILTKHKILNQGNLEA